MTRLGDERPKKTLVRFQRGSKHFFLLNAKPLVQLTQRALSPGVDWSRLEAQNSLPSRAEFKIVWSYASASPYGFTTCTASITFIRTSKLLMYIGYCHILLRKKLPVQF